VRILNWNIQQFGPTKVAVPGMVPALGRVIAGTQADVVIITEVSNGTALVNMAALAGAANAAAGGALYTAWATSYETGGERYGVIIRDIDTVRPIIVAVGPTGEAEDPLTNMELNRFTTWPNTFAALGVAGALPAPPDLPLVDVFASTPPVGRKRKRFAGGSLADGAGYALGNGFRLPSLIMLSVLNGAGGPPHLIPVLVCHLGAVRGGANALARGQIAQYKDTGIAQRFSTGRYIDLDGAPVAVRELVITGDFNVDFQQNVAGAPGIAGANHAAYDHLTPTQTGGVSGVPPALPGALVPPPAVLPFPMPLGGWPDGPISNTIPDLALRTAITTRGTMLNVPVAPGAAAVPPYAAPTCFDNFFYGGAQLAGAAVGGVAGVGVVAAAPGIAGETGVIVNPALTVVRAPAAPPAANLAPVWADHLLPVVVPPGLKRQWALWAPSLNPAFMGGPITNEARLVGARFLSDHLPTVLQANLP
jgi:hypothetical protein